MLSLIELCLTVLIPASLLSCCSGREFPSCSISFFLCSDFQPLLAFLGLYLFLIFSTRSTFSWLPTHSSPQHLNMLHVSSTKNKACRVDTALCFYRTCTLATRALETLLHLVLSGIPSTAFYAL